MSPLLPAGVLAAAGPALPPNPTLLENLEFQLVGLVIVMGALTALYLLCAAVGRLFTRLEARAPAVAGAPASGAQAPAPAPLEDAPTAEHAALIAAAVAATVVQPHRIVAVKPAASGWSLEGRRQLLTSHQLKR